MVNLRIPLSIYFIRFDPLYEGYLQHAAFETIVAPQKFMTRL